MTRQTRKRKHTANKKYRKENRNLRTRTKDIDQVHDELLKGVTPDPDTEVPEPGGGLFYCISCARHFINEETLKDHCKTKPHKRRLKEALKTPYTDKDAERAAEMTHEGDNDPFLPKPMATDIQAA